uniref:WD repeat and coiled-coil-containing protein n=2 Tax=Latimeria chalumnae TaxID=7897 RepID=H3B353_LATCH
MELGKAKLLRTGLNALAKAVHPEYGVAWTDGKQVVLTCIYQVNGEIKFGDSTVIGQFEHVHGLCWGLLNSTGVPALLAVQHKKHVTVWQLQQSVLEHNKLLVSQTCEFGEPFPILPQGCVWHPKKDILAVLTKRDASVLFSVRSDNCRVKADIKGSGLIHCACWSKEGNRLVIAIGSALHSYIWNDLQKTLSACNFCPIFEVGGYICAIEATVDSQVAVATELPLDKICGLNAGITFDVPSSNEIGSLASQSSVLVVGSNYSTGFRRQSVDSERSVASSLGPVDLTHILANHRKSDPSPLIHLKHRDYLTGSGQDSSHLLLVTFERKVTTTRKVSIPGILVPDIIAFDPQAHIVAVASNTCNMVLVYSVTSSSMPNIQQIQLLKNERPKGLSFLTDKLLLILVGKQKSNEPAFLPSSNSDKYVIHLMTKGIVFDEGTSALSGAQQIPHSGSESGVIPGIRKFFENLSREDKSAGRELLMPGGIVIQSPSGRRQLIEEVKISSCDQSPMSSVSDLAGNIPSVDSCMSLENFNAEPVNRSVVLHGLGASSRDSSRSSSPRVDLERFHHASTLPKNNTLPKDKMGDQFAKNLEALCASFTDVQQRLAEIMDFTNNGKKLSVSYPSSSEPPFIYAVCQKSISGNTFIHKKRSVLLCEGKLRLSIIQEIFNLSIIEMLHGSSWIVLIADNEGFIPLTFTANQEIIIRDGKDS